MEQQSKSFLPKIMSFFFIAIGIFLGFYAFFANATNWTLPLGSGRNNTTMYLDSTFWNNTPTSGDIIAALYGSGDEGSIYTQNWSGYTSGSCLINGMNVEYISAGISTIPLNLSGNTIYVLNSGDYLTTGTINFSGCTAIVGIDTVHLYSTGYIQHMINIQSVQNTIIDTLSINGYDDGSGGTHTLNNNGIYMNYSSNNLLYNIQTYNHQNAGIFLDTSSNNGLFHIQTYDNIYGIMLQTSGDNTLETIQTYKNQSVGLYLRTSSNNNINNVQAYNNQSYGIKIDNSSVYNTINNTQAYNNQYGIVLNDASNFTVLNTVQAYNNQYGIYLDMATSNSVFHDISLYNNTTGIYVNFDCMLDRYYGTLNIFGNGAGVGGSGSNFNTGTFYTSFGRTIGQVITGQNMSWEYITNPINASGDYSLDWNSGFINLIDAQRGWQTTNPISYSLGGMINKQQQPVLWSGGNLITGGNFDANTFIGSQNIFLSGSIVISGGAFANISGTIVSLASATTMQYRIFGDIVNEITGTIFTGLEINTILTGADGLKNIFVQFSTGDNWATHYQTTVTLDTTYPTFTGTTLLAVNVTSGGYYTTGVSITFDDVNLSGATLNGSGYASGTLITGDATYTFIVSDLAGNATGMMFTIDTVSPTLTGVTSGTYYNSSVTITGNDNVLFSGFTLNGTPYTGNSLTITGDGVRIITGYDYAGNVSTGITFTIDTTYPIFTGTTLSGDNVVSGGYYNTTGVSITFDDVNLSGATLNGSGYASGTLITGDATYTFIVSDLAGNATGMMFTIDTTNPIVTGNYPTTGLTINTTSNINFTRSGYDNIMISGYTLYVTGTEIHTITTGSTNYLIVLPNGTYTWYVMITDRAGNTYASTPSTFDITTPLMPTMTMSTANLQYNAARYTKDYISIYFRTNKLATYSFSGDFVGTPLTGSVNGGTTGNLYLTGDGIKNINLQVTDGVDTTGQNFTVRLDTTAPSLPTLITPASGGVATGAFTLDWSDSLDAGIGTSGFQYFVLSTGIYASVVKSGFTNASTTYANVANNALGSPGTYYRYVTVMDKLGNTGTTVMQSFEYSGVVDTTPDAFSFNTITSANTNQIYGSNTITINGLAANTPVLASITAGALFISGTMVGTTGYVQNGWTVKIEMNSSINYNTLVSSTLTIGGVSAIFSITTENDNINNDNISTNLSSTERLQIIAIFEALRDLYAGDKEIEFFNSFMVMIQSKIDGLGTSVDDVNRREALQYLYDLADQYNGNEVTTGLDIENTSRIINGVYTAPNGKKYKITYDSIKKFTSSNFITPKYYPTLDVLKYDIDRNNPMGSSYLNAKTIKARWGRISIDGTRQTSAYTAPNRKVFYFFKTTEGQYSSYTFTVERYFDSLEAVKEYIHNSNLR